MSVLGALLLRRGDFDGAEPHLRAATAAGDRAAANNLGVLLHQRGTPTRPPDGGGSPPSPVPPAAAHAFGRHHRERGDEPAAEYWLCQSAEQGHALGAYALADLLEHRGDDAEGSERWMRAAAERGHREGAYRLARDPGPQGHGGASGDKADAAAGRGGRAVVPAGRRARTPPRPPCTSARSWRSAAS
ncbi:hypothetical protein STENM223S_02023 [Streptomyces tendae]